MGYWEGLEHPPNAGQVSHPNGGETNMVLSGTVGGETRSLATAGGYPVDEAATTVCT